METLWNINTKDYNLNNITKLESQKDYDVAIVGGGLSALLTAYFLKDSSLKIGIFCDKDFSQSASSRSNAKITTVNTSLYSDINKYYGINNAKFFYFDKYDAMMSYVKIIKDHNISCDLEKTSSFVYSTSETGRDKLISEMSFFNSANIPFIHHTETLEDLIKIKNAYEFQNQYSFNPVKFMLSLVSIMNGYDNIDFYNYSPVTKITNSYLIANGKKVNFKKSVLATRFPILKALGQFPLKMYQEKAMLGCFTTSTPIKNMYVSVDEDDLSLRPLNNNTVILVGNNQRLGEKSKNKINLESYAKENFKDVENFITYSNQDCVTFDGLPYVDTACIVLPNVYVATGYNLFGITSSMLSAKHIAKNIVYKQPLPKLYSRNRFKMKAQKELGNKHLKTVFSELLHRNPRLNNHTQNDISTLKNGEGFTFRYKNKNLGVSRQDGKLIYIKNKCTHLGCPLYFNNTTQTWDCHCHGSSYKPNGEYIFSPTKENLEVIDINNLN